MAAMKISELASVSAAAEPDFVPVVQSGVNKKATIADLGVALGVEKRWTTIPTANYTATPASTSQITMSSTTGIAVGMPARYSYNGTTYYGYVVTVTTNTSIVLAGAPLDVGHNLTALAVGRPEMMVSVPFHIAGAAGVFATGAADLLADINNQAYRWAGARAYCVDYLTKEKTEDTGTEPRINIKIDGNLLSTTSSNNGVQLLSTWQSNGVAINTSNYDIDQGNAVEVRCTVAGGAGDAAYLDVILLFVLP